MDVLNEIIHKLYIWFHFCVDSDELFKAQF
jgi:hypothetical protein